MAIIRNIFRVLAEYFSFLIGFVFIFVIGVLYAFLHDEGLLVNIVFLIIAIGWMVYLIKSFWDLMEKKKSDNENNEDIKIEIEDDEHDNGSSNNENLNK